MRFLPHGPFQSPGYQTSPEGAKIPLLAPRQAPKLSLRASLTASFFQKKLVHFFLVKYNPLKNRVGKRTLILFVNEKKTFAFH